MRRLAVPSLIVLAGLLASCASIDETQGNRSADELFAQGRQAMLDGFYETAIKQFDALSAQYPFNRHAPQVLLGLAYAHYKQDEPESAIAEANEFIKTYPRHPDVDYAYYLRGLARFDRTRAFGDELAGIDPAQRDPREARESLRYFADLIRRFPKSRYVADARQRIVYLRNYLARHELHVARYYLGRRAAVAAAGRARSIIEDYPRTEVVPEALEILAAAYRMLGIDDLAADAERVRRLNPPPAIRPDANPTSADSGGPDRRRAERP